MTTTLPGLAYVAPATSPTEDYRAATGHDAWPTAEPSGPQVGDLWLIAVESAELAVAVVTEATEHWVAVLPARVAAAAPTGARLDAPGLPALEVWTGMEATIGTHLLAQRIAPVTTAAELAALGTGHGPAPADVEATWASLNLGIDTGR